LFYDTVSATKDMKRRNTRGVMIMNE